MDIRWIVESDILSYTDNLVKYLKENGIYYKETNYQEVISYNYNDDFGGLVDTEVATIFIGSLRLAKKINSYPLYPGVICSLKKFDCLNYYPSWNKYLLNKDWTITLPLILERHCREGDTTKKFFFRPNEGDKVFNGGLYTKSELISKRLQESSVIIQAGKKHIIDELRFLVVDKKIVSHTRYLNYPKNSGFYQSARCLLERALDSGVLIPDRAFTVDIGVTNTNIGVIELNSFSCANLYNMEMNKVVPAINELAKNMYSEANNDW